MEFWEAAVENLVASISAYSISAYNEESTSLCTASEYISTLFPPKLLAREGSMEGLKMLEGVQVLMVSLGKAIA